MKKEIKNKLRKFIIENIENDCPFLVGNELNENDWYEGLLLQNNRLRLDEGLIKSYPLNFAIQRFGEYGLVKHIQNGIYLQLKSEYFSKLSEVNSYIESLGYFISQYKVLEIGNTKREYIDYKKLDDIINILANVADLWLVIEPKFDSTIDTTTLQFIYHLTERVYLPRIKEKGLIPKSKGKKVFHPDRIYVVTDINKIKPLLGQFKTQDNDFVILKIDYKLSGSPVLYNDPNYLDMGYYIIDNIKPQAINNIIELKDLR